MGGMNTWHEIPVVGGPFDGISHTLNENPTESVTIEPTLAFDANALRTDQGLPPLEHRRVAVYQLVHLPGGWRFVFDRIKTDGESVDGVG